nr:RNA degradosome polyphosphate kinase [Gemmatimonadaceae bacterium]
MSETLPADLFINRELSWLAFNARVLHESLDSRVPLLERLKFLAIFSSNLDEFFMVRVAGLRRQVAAGVDRPSADGLSPVAQLEAIGRTVDGLLVLARESYETLMALLAPHGVRLLAMDDLARSEREALDEYFESQIFPVLTPLAVDPGHPFPYISNLSLSLAVEIRDPHTGDEHFARVKVPKILPRWLPVPGRPHHFIPLERLMASNLDALFPGLEVTGCYPFRITRYSDLEIPELDEADDLLEEIEEQVFKRRLGEVVRLEVVSDMPEGMRSLLLEELGDEDVPEAALLSPRDVQVCGSLLDLSDLMALASIDLPELRYPPFAAKVPGPLHDVSRNIFDVIREGDILLH